MKNILTLIVFMSLCMMHTSCLTKKKEFKIVGLKKVPNKQKVSKKQKVVIKEEKKVAKVRNKKRLLKKVATTKTPDKKEIVKTYTYTYGKNNFVEKIEGFEVTTFGKEGTGIIKMFNKEEIVFEYNKQDQLIKEIKYKFVGKDKKINFTENYAYDNLGYLVSSEYIDGKIARPREYIYNQKCILDHVDRNMKKIKYKVKFNYHFKEGKLDKINVASDKEVLNKSSFIFDDKINPKFGLYPKRFSQAFPVKITPNNLVNFTKKGKKFYNSNTSTIEYVKDYPKKITTQYLSGKKIDNKEVTEYFYK